MRLSFHDISSNLPLDTFDEVIWGGVEGFGRRILMKLLSSLGRLFFAIMRGRGVFLFSNLAPVPPSPL